LSEVANQTHAVERTFDTEVGMGRARATARAEAEARVVVRCNVTIMADAGLASGLQCLLYAKVFTMYT
jgi:hypothetical protein